MGKNIDVDPLPSLSVVGIAHPTGRSFHILEVIVEWALLPPLLNDCFFDGYNLARRNNYGSPNVSKFLSYIHQSGVYIPFLI